jgi:hypothetical protein
MFHRETMRWSRIIRGGFPPLLTWIASTAPGMSSSRRREIEIVDVGIIRFPLHIREGFENQW